MKKKLFILCSIAVVMLAASIAFTQKIKPDSSGKAFAALETESNTMLEKSRTVVLEKVVVTPLENITRYPGSVKACNETRMAFRVSGPLIRLNIKAGDQVRKGDVLMQIDPQDFKDKILVLDAQLSGALAQLENAHQDFARMKQLFGEKVIPQADFDHAKATQNIAEANVKGIHAQLKIARHQLDYTTLKSPYDGIITETHIENHEMVAPGQMMVGIHDISNLEIKINVPENEIINHPLVSGTKAWVKFSSFGQRQFPVTLKEWSTAADKATRSYGTTFTMPRPQGIQILPGMTAEIQWPGIQDQNKSITMPVKAVLNDSIGTAHVWLFDSTNSMASKVPITLGPLYGSSRIVVESGLALGDPIVTDGVDFITNETKLIVTLANTEVPRTDLERSMQ